MQVGTTVKKILPQIDDPDSSDTWTITIDNLQSSGLYQFTSLSNPRLTFSPWDSSHSGDYFVTLILKDNRGSVSSYSFNLLINDPLFIESSTSVINNTTNSPEKNVETQNDTVESI